jgi:hypothetical protein
MPVPEPRSCIPGTATIGRMQTLRFAGLQVFSEPLRQKGCTRNRPCTTRTSATTLAYNSGRSKVGGDLDTLRRTRDRVLNLGYTIDGQSDHTVSQSLYLRDPDGDEVELFVYNPRYDWRKSDSWMEAPVKPLVL